MALLHCFYAKFDRLLPVPYAKIAEANARLDRG